MMIKEKLGNLKTFTGNNRSIDRLPLEWYETGKRILHKRTLAGTEVVLKFLGEGPQLEQDDVIYADAKGIIAIDIVPCEAIVIQPLSMYQMALVCYEIGNKHLPLFYEADHLLIPYEAPIFRMLQAWDVSVDVQHRKLQNPLKTSVAAHSHGSRESLFSKVMKLTTTADGK